MAWGPRKKVLTWPIYFVNGFNFHIEEWSIGKQIVNYGVCVKGEHSGDKETYYYGVIKEIMQLEYIGEPRKQLVLFNCQ